MLNFESSVLKSMREPIASQCNSFMTGVIPTDLFCPKPGGRTVLRVLIFVLLGQNNQQAPHDESIDHYLKVILAQILPQSANRSNDLHSLFACFIGMMTKIELSIQDFDNKLETSLRRRAARFSRINSKLYLAIY